jgi:mono/diheme cytochrome c family protein
MIASGIAAIYALFSRLGYHHPLHPTQVHIPVGLIFGAFAFSVWAKMRRRPIFSKAAWYCMILALIWILPTIVTGLMDWKHFFAGILVFPFKMKFILAAMLVFFLIIGVSIGFRSGTESNSLIAIYALCLLTVAGLGFFGGELVYGNKPAAAISENLELEKYQSGRALYAANCGGCHANGGNTIKPELPVKHSPKTADFQTFLAWVRNPRAPMPAYPEEVLSDQQARDMYQYIVNVLNKP